MSAELLRFPATAQTEMPEGMRHEALRDWMETHTRILGFWMDLASRKFFPRQQKKPVQGNPHRLFIEEVGRGYSPGIGSTGSNVPSSLRVSSAIFTLRRWLFPDS